jgi:hypothetical protein
VTASSLLCSTVCVCESWREGGPAQSRQVDIYLGAKKGVDCFAWAAGEWNRQKKNAAEMMISEPGMK